MGKYNAKEIENKWRKFWETEGIYKFDFASKKPVYSIDTPPPYASAGHLHVGHALSYTQFEIVARAMRMLGANVYFPPGFDDNGLPTEKYVEEKYKINKAKTDRAKFRKLCLEESKKVEKVYTENVFQKLGHSYDWELVYQTISPEAQKVTQTAFLRLIKKGECYRAKEPTIWCTEHDTALAQAEVEDLKRITKLNHIYFETEEGKKIEIATTRPEFLPACVGVFVNPKDVRYKNLVGKNAIVPLFKNKVKIGTDENVDMDFGSGVLMTCTFGDTADIEKWKRHALPLKIIITPEGKMNELAGKYQGKKLEEARKLIIEDLKKSGHFIKEESIEQTVGSCERCGNPVEYIVKDQWFIRTLKHKEKLLEMGRKVKWHPEFMRVRYDDWVKNLAWDWTISRQRYYGVPIPVWYCEKCNEIIFPEEKELPLDPLEIKKKCPKCRGETIPETDVFDTWMTSSNSPEIALRWLKNPKQYEKFAPMSLRPQSHDIIRTWAFYTILKSYLLFNRIPWKDLIINTFVLDEKGKGMHKSKGNAIWADEIIEKYGVDALRYWIGTANLGSDLPFKEQEIVAGQKFLTKLWNATNFVFMNLENYNGEKPKRLEKIDNLFLRKLNEVVENVRTNYSEYKISKAKQEIEQFFWQMFCDNYLEIVKKRVYRGEGDAKKSAQYTLYSSLLTIIKMFAPITPFITEEIYQNNFRENEKTKSIHLCEFPHVFALQKYEKKYDDVEGADDFNSLIEVLGKIRQEKTNQKKPMNAECILTLDKKTLKKISGMEEDLKNVINAKEIREGKFGVEFI